jgi:oligopeptide/dipeptide ABC transporter ATP-binding protein
LEVEDLTIGYAGPAGETIVVEDVELHVAPGEARGLVGESGSGKTSVARAVSGLLGRTGRITRGKVRVAGHDLTSLPERSRARLRRQAVSVVFQDPLNALDPIRSIYSQVAEAIRLRREGGSHLSRSAMRSAVADLLGRVEIQDARSVMSRFPHELSGGMRQRVALGMAVAGDTQLLIADEPTTALDVATQAEILSLLERLVRDAGMGLLFITHNIALVSQFCDTISVMYAGMVVEEGACKGVVGTPAHPYTRGLIRAIPSLAGPRREVVGIPGFAPAAGETWTGCRFEPRCPLGHGVPVCETAVPARDAVGAVDGSRFVRCHQWEKALAQSESADGA